MVVEEVYAYRLRVVVGFACLVVGSGGCTEPPISSSPADGGSHTHHESGSSGERSACIQEAPLASIPDGCPSDVTHCEQSDALGIEDNPAYGRGVALVDLDGDGWLDIWRSDSGSPVDGHVMRAGAHRNRGDATFEPWDLGIAEEDVIMNWAGVFGDIDNDGDLDLFLVNGGYEGDRSCALYRNDLAETGGFTEITEAAGIETDPLWWWGAAFADFDGDGDLDLVVTGRSGNRSTSGVDTVRLYRNDGTGSFEEVSDELGLPDPQGDLKNPIWIDYDRDGDQDLVISRAVPNVLDDGQVGLFENRGDAGFVYVDPLIFPGHPVLADEIFAFAVSAADFNQDGWQDIYLGRWDSQDYIAINQRDGAFELVGPEVGLETPDDLNTMGLTVGDFTGNGFPDVLIGPGNPVEAKPPLAFCSLGVGVDFERCEDDFLAAVGESRWHGAAVGDLDHDFDQDVVWNLGGFASYDQSRDVDTRDGLTIFINQDGPDEPTASVRLRGTESPDVPYGTKLRLETEPRWHKVLHGTQGFQSQNPLEVLIPLGSNEAETLTVTWPSGRVERFDLHAWTACELVEGRGRIVRDS